MNGKRATSASLACCKVSYPRTTRTYLPAASLAGGTINCTVCFASSAETFTENLTEPDSVWTSHEYRENCWLGGMSTARVKGLFAGTDSSGASPPREFALMSESNGRV